MRSLYINFEKVSMSQINNEKPVIIEKPFIIYGINKDISALKAWT